MNWLKVQLFNRSTALQLHCLTVQLVDSSTG
jgi:hypothetical protein